MTWLSELITGSGIAHAIFIYSLVIAIGVILGKVKFFGISLGATFVLFTGILAGHLGLEVDPSILKFIQEFGLILFIFSIGLQVGPGFFSSFKEGGLLLIVMSVQDEEVFDAFIGPQVEMDWKHDPAPVVSRRIVVTNSKYTGRKLGSLRLHLGYQLNATRVNRAGVDLVAAPNLALQVGDRITVVGNIDDINHLAEKMGNSLRRLDEPNLFTMFIGIFMGILVGSIPLMFPGMTVPMKLGLAGGPLVVAILMGRYGYKVKLVTYTSSSAHLLLRELGICLFLASVGIAAGGNFAATVFSSNGALWVVYGFAITFIPLAVVVMLARGKFGMNYCTLMGLVAGSTTDPPALAYANKTANNDEPAVAYSTVYPLTMFLRVITAQLLVMFFA